MIRYRELVPLFLALGLVSLYALLLFAPGSLLPAQQKSWIAGALLGVAGLCASLWSEEDEEDNEEA